MGLSPVDIYVKRAWDARVKRNVAPKKFYRNPISKVDYTFLQGKQVPTEIQVYNVQKQHMYNHFSKYKKKFEKYIGPINYDMAQSNGNLFIDYPADIQAVKQQVEAFCTFTLSKDLTQSNSDAISKNIRNELKESTINYQDFKHYLKDATMLYKKLKNQDYLNSKDFQQQVQKLKNFITVANNMGRQYRGSKKAIPTGGLFKELEKINASIKSRFLELAAMETIKSILDKTIPIEIIDTAKTRNVHLNLLGQAKNSPRTSEYDLLLGLKVKTLKGGQQKTLNDYIQGVNEWGNKTYDVRNLVDEYGALGVQVKSALIQGNQRIPKPFNSSKKSGYVTLQDAINTKMRNASAMLLMLNRLMGEGGGSAKNVFYHTDTKNPKGPIYNPLFNYAIAKNLNNVVGTANVLIATSNGIQYMDEYIYDNNYYIAAGQGQVNITQLNKKITLIMKRRQ